MRYLKNLIPVAVLGLVALVAIDSASAAGRRRSSCGCCGTAAPAAAPAPPATAEAPSATRRFSYEPGTAPVYRAPASRGFDALAPLRAKGLVQ